MKLKSTIVFTLIIIYTLKSFSCSCGSLTPLPYPNIITYNSYSHIFLEKTAFIPNVNKLFTLTLPKKTEFYRVTVYTSDGRNTNNIAVTKHQISIWD